MESINENNAPKEVFGLEEKIINQIDNPKSLEKLYRRNKTSFERSFNSIFPQIADNSNAQVWNERLNYLEEETSAFNTLLFT